MEPTDIPDLVSQDPVIPIGEDIVVPLEDENALTYSDDEPNLVAIFEANPKGRTALQEIASIVDSDFQNDWDGSSKHREEIKEDIRLFTGDLEPKTFPFEHSANAHVPIMLTNITRLQSRIETEVFGDWTSVASVVPVGPGDEDVAEILTQHLIWQIREQIPDFERQCKRAVQSFLVCADAFVESYFDPFTRRNAHVTLTPDEFVIPFSFVSTQPDLSDLPHYTRVLRYYRHQLQAQRDKWFGVDDVLARRAPSWGDVEMPIREDMAKIQGEDMPEDLSKRAPYVILKYCGWLQLPNQDRDRWCQVIMDKSTRRILSLSIYEETNWQDGLRYQRQLAEMDAYRMAMAQHAQTMSGLEQQAQMMLAADENVGLGDMQREALRQNLMSQIPPQPPAPQWLQDPNDLSAMPETARKDPIHLVAHAVCIEPLSGAYGISYGRILADYNRAANTLLSQYVDSATLANVSGLIVSDEVDFDRPFSWAPGRINKAKGVSGAELKNAIMPLQTQPANPQMVQLIEMMSAFGSDAAQSPEVLSGNPGKSGETYRGIATRIDQAVKNLTVIGRAIAALIRQVLRNNAKLNATFLPDEEIFQVTKGTLKYMEPIRVTREMYHRNYEVRIVSDLQFQGDQERIAEADQILQMSTAFPQLQGNLAFFYEALKRALKARRQYEMLGTLGPKPPDPETPLAIPPPPPPTPPPQGGPSGGPPGGPPPPGPPPGNHPQGVGGPAPGSPPPPPPPTPPQPQAA